MIKLFKRFIHRKHKKQLIRAERNGYMLAMNISKAKLQAEKEKFEYLLKCEQDKNIKIEKELRGLQHYINSELGEEVIDLRMLAYKIQNSLRIREMNQAKQNQEVHAITDDTIMASNKLIKKMTKVQNRVNKKIQKVI